MALRRKAISPLDPIAVLNDRIERLEKQVKSLRQAGPTTIQRADTADTAEAVQGEIVLHSPALTDLERIDEDENFIQRRTQQVRYFHNGRWHSFGDFVIILFNNDETPEIQDEIVSFPISKDLDGAKLQRVEAAVRWGGSGPTVINVLNGFTTMLTTPCQIDSGDINSTLSNTPVDIDIINNQVFWRDEVVVSITAVASGSLGLRLNLGFS